MLRASFGIVTINLTIDLTAGGLKLLESRRSGKFART
jgi:hypothetical protein